ncbi:serine/threonine protein kinase VPS15, putative [Plasmodium gallinaceum]|uniref:Serine/threonine protein kinase VPS15, putative n=1 Tax=Plasmodium gallinaceum TaxID=5849 RepID=A0A1J1GLZ4_PLAGA|nr:serine/threonine protein kinase VPS15, putative [Plasmodium gallinaceum]CRG93456.1 serine/threonine protein kinase VPS15, putative [Plasmodium gallinaceum]
MGNTIYSNIGHSTTDLDDIYCKYVNNLYNIYNYLFKYEHFFFMNSYTLNNFYHVLEGINNNEGHVLIKICKLKSEAHKIKRILYTLKFLFSFDLFPNVLPYNRMSVYENNIYIYRRFIFKNLDQYLSSERNNYSFYYFFIFQIFLSVIQLHSLGVYHGHIKSENFLIQNNMHILITDINILNNYLYFIPKIRYKNKRKGRLKKLQEDIFNLGLLILEILLKDKSVSYLFFNGNFDGNDDNFYTETKENKKLYLTEDTKRQKFDNYNLSKKKNSEKFFHALSLPIINKRMKNEEYDYFKKNKDVRMNIDKYRYYNYHYINNINYINIYNDIYNNVTSYSVIESNNESCSYGNDKILKSKTILHNDNEIDAKEDIHAHSDFDVLNSKKEIKNKVLHNLNFQKKHDLFSDNSYMLLNNLKKRKDKKSQKYKNNKVVPYKIWKVVNLVKNPFIIYSLINHFFIQKNNNIFKIFNYWSYYIFPSTYKYVFFPLSILQLHPLFKNSNFFILLIHFNLPFILFHLDIFSEKEKDKYILLKLNAKNRHDYCKNKNYNVFDKNCVNRDSTDKNNNNRSSYKKLFYYKTIVNLFTTSVNEHQMRTYIVDTNLNNQLKKQILQQWINYKKKKKEEKKKCYHCKSYFPFPILSYKNTHLFYKRFLEFYKFIYYCIFYKEKSYMDVFGYLEFYKKNIYLPLFNDFYFKKSTSYENKKLHKWSFNQDIYKLVNIIISSYNSISYESIKILAIEIIYCIICHLSDCTLNKEIVSFLLYCFNNSTNKIKVLILKCFYKIINNANTYEHMHIYVEKFLPKFYLLKNSENYEKYFYAKYLPLFSFITIQYIYNASLLKKKNKTIENTLSEVKYMETLNEIRNQLVFLLNCSNDEILFEFYENINRFCKIMNKKWVKIYILPYLLSNIYNSENKFIRAMCAKTTIRIIFYINQKKIYKNFIEYLKPLFFEKNELMLEFILCECNFILKKSYKKYHAKSQKVWIFFKKIRLNHLLDHPSGIIRNLVQTINKNLQKIVC